MQAKPTQYFPGFPSTADPQIVRMLKHLFDRVNYLVTTVNQMQVQPQGLAGTQKEVKGLKTALQAVQDALTQGGTFVAFGQAQPFSETQTVSFSATGVGYSISGPSNAATITVTNATTARGAINAAVATAVGAHTITLAALTGGGTQGSISWNADGTVTAFVDPT